MRQLTPVRVLFFGKVNQMTLKLKTKDLHLTYETLALHFDINKRTIQRWVNGKSEAELWFVDAIDQWLDWKYKSSQTAFSHFMDAVAKRDDSTMQLVLINYSAEDFVEMVTDDFPVEVHQASLARITYLVEQAGHAVKVIKMDKNAYFEWLREHELDDSQPNRNAWGAVQNEK